MEILEADDREDLSRTDLMGPTASSRNVKIERNPGLTESESSRDMRSGQFYIGGCTDTRLGRSVMWFQRLLQSFAPAIHAKPSRLSAGNGPLGLWAGLYAESRSRGTEEKGPSPQRPPAVDTPLAVDCGSCVIPFPGRIPTFAPEPFA